MADHKLPNNSENSHKKDRLLIERVKLASLTSDNLRDNDDSDDRESQDHSDAFSLSSHDSQSLDSASLSSSEAVSNSQILTSSMEFSYIDIDKPFYNFPDPSSLGDSVETVTTQKLACSFVQVNSDAEPDSPPTSPPLVPTIHSKKAIPEVALSEQNKTPRKASGASTSERIVSSAVASASSPSSAPSSEHRSRLFEARETYLQATGQIAAVVPTEPEPSLLDPSPAAKLREATEIYIRQISDVIQEVLYRVMALTNECRFAVRDLKYLRKSTLYVLGGLFLLPIVCYLAVNVPISVPSSSVDVPEASAYPSRRVPATAPYRFVNTVAEKTTALPVTSSKALTVPIMNTVSPAELLSCKEMEAPKQSEELSQLMEFLSQNSFLTRAVRYGIVAAMHTEVALDGVHNVSRELYAKAREHYVPQAVEHAKRGWSTAQEQGAALRLWLDRSRPQLAQFIYEKLGQASAYNSVTRVVKYGSDQGYRGMKKKHIEKRFRSFFNTSRMRSLFKGKNRKSALTFKEKLSSLLDGSLNRTRISKHSGDYKASFASLVHNLKKRKSFEEWRSKSWTEGTWSGLNKVYTRVKGTRET